MTTPPKATFDQRKMFAWLRDSQEGRTLVAKAAARLCRDCPRVKNVLKRCETCQHRARSEVTSELLDKIPPNSPEAEAGLIGSVLLDPAGHRQEITATAPEDFYAEANEAIWRQLQAMAGDSIDVTLLAERLKRAGEWDAVGGAAYLVEVLQSQAVAAHAAHYATIVREKAQLRGAIQAACDVLRACYDVGASLENGGEVRKAAMSLLEILGI